VSGLALGIDAAAHRGCLDAGGDAVAVLGSGIDRLYPRRNVELAKRILVTGGAIVSEFGPGVDPEPWRFPFRNRIISGLSGVVVVVEAADRSGALITASLAASHGREVIAVPGDLGRSTSRGCNRLIRDGAHPLVDPDEIVEMVELFMGPAPRRSRVRAASGSDPVLGVLPATIDDLVSRTGMGPADLMLVVADGVIAGSLTLDGSTVRSRAV
jgi:DNA processing protein